MHSKTPPRIGFDHPFQPFGYLEGGRPAGMRIELVAAAMERAGLAFEWAPMTLEETEPALFSGAVDALAFKGVIPERFGTMDFSPPLVVSGAALFRSPALPGHDDPRRFPGSRVVTTRRGPFAAQLAREYPELERVLVDSQEEALEALAAGRADLAALNFHSGRQMAAELHPGRIALPRTPYAPLPVALAVAKGRSAQLLREFSATLAAMQEDGSAQRVIDRWLED
jgi:polar amino acid transport system substrate-binding protein